MVFTRDHALNSGVAQATAIAIAVEMPARKIIVVMIRGQQYRCGEREQDGQQRDDGESAVHYPPIRTVMELVPLSSLGIQHLGSQTHPATAVTAHFGLPFRGDGGNRKNGLVSVTVSYSDHKHCVSPSCDMPHDCS